MWVPKGKVKLGGSKWLDASRLGSSPSGRLWAVNASKATAPSAMVRSGDPATVNVPLAYSRSSGATSNWWAAISLALAITFSVASHTAVPPTASDREP